MKFFDSELALVYIATALIGLPFLALIYVGAYVECEKMFRKAKTEERLEAVEWACWCDSYADTRAAQEKYLQERRAK